MTSIFLVDEQTVFLEGLTCLLADSTEIEVLGTSADRNEALAKVTELRPDVVVTETSGPGMSICEFVSALPEYGPSTGVLVLTANEDVQTASLLLGQGVHGYVLKKDSFADILTAIKAISNGGVFISPQVAGWLLQHQVSATPPLTKRQLEILRQVASGAPSKLIAKNMGLHVKTIDNHRRAIMDKFGVNTSVEMVHEAAKMRLI